MDYWNKCQHLRKVTLVLTLNLGAYQLIIYLRKVYNFIQENFILLFKKNLYTLDQEELIYLSFKAKNLDTDQLIQDTSEF